LQHAGRPQEAALSAGAAYAVRRVGVWHCAARPRAYRRLCAAPAASTGVLTPALTPPCPHHNPYPCRVSSAQAGSAWSCAWSRGRPPRSCAARTRASWLIRRTRRACRARPRPAPRTGRPGPGARWTRARSRTTRGARRPSSCPRRARARRSGALAARRPACARASRGDRACQHRPALCAGRYAAAPRARVLPRAMCAACGRLPISTDAGGPSPRVCAARVPARVRVRTVRPRRAASGPRAGAGV